MSYSQEHLDPVPSVSARSLAEFSAVSTPSAAVNGKSAVKEHASAARLLVLDGWRAVSILLVLAAHMLPLGPKALMLNETSALAGMSLFFTLSGFLITTNLLKHPDVGSFLIRRACRILPLAFLATVGLLTIQAKSRDFYIVHFLFLENYLTDYLTGLTGHLWSLCVEVHFYVFIALLVAIAGRGGLLALPAGAMLITALRIAHGVKTNIITHYRADEILAGATLALVYAGRLGGPGRGWRLLMQSVPLWTWLILLLLVASPLTGPLQYARPYIGSAVVGHTLLSNPTAYRWLRNRFMRYIAEISYALYVIHPSSMFGWLGSGDKLVKYMKRPISLVITFGLAHLSTFHMEHHFIAWGKRMTHRRDYTRRKFAVAAE